MVDLETFKAAPILPAIAPNDVVREIQRIEIQNPITVDRQVLYPYKVTCYDENSAVDGFKSTTATESLRRLLERADVEVDSTLPAQPREAATILIHGESKDKAEALFVKLFNEISQSAARGA